MKILIVTSSSQGLLRFSEQLAKGLMKYSTQVQPWLLVFDKECRVSVNRVANDENIAKSRRLILGAIRAHSLLILEKLLGKLDYDIIHVNYAVSSLLSLYVKKNPRCVYTIHGFPRPMLETKIADKVMYAMEDMLLRASAGLTSLVRVSISKYVQQVLRALYGINSMVIWHGIDEELFSPCDYKTKVLLRMKRGLDSDKFVVLWVGRLTLMKDPLTFLRSLMLIKKRHPDSFRHIHIYMIGKGPMMPHINGILSKLDGHLEILPELDFKRLLEIYKLADAYVSCSVGEPFGLSLTEAMACGCVPIATSSGAHTEILPSDYPLLFSPRDYHALANLLLSLLKDEKEKRTLSRNVRQRILSKFRLEIMTKNYERVYSEIVG